MFNLVNLDARTRSFMLDEFQRDIAADTLYVSPRLSPAGRSVYANLLRDALESGSPESLSAALDSPRFFNSTEMRDHATGDEIETRIPDTAAQTLAEGEFIRFYLRGLCLRAISEGVDRLVVYRAKEVEQPRNASQQRIGDDIAPGALLADLREHVDTIFGVPAGPNSGLCVRI